MFLLPCITSFSDRPPPLQSVLHSSIDNSSKAWRSEFIANLAVVCNGFHLWQIQGHNKLVSFVIQTEKVWREGGLQIRWFMNLSRWWLIIEKTHKFFSVHFKWNLHPYNVGLINQTKVSLVTVLFYPFDNITITMLLHFAKSYNPGQGTK